MSQIKEKEETMDIDELIDRLQDLRDYHGNINVRGVFQPNYPLLAQIIAVTTITKDSKTEVFIGLGDGKDYGSELHYEDCEVDEEDEGDED